MRTIHYSALILHLSTLTHVLHLKQYVCGIFAVLTHFCKGREREGLDLDIK